MEKAKNEEFHSLYRSLNIVWVIKSRRLRWPRHVARMEEGRSAFKILAGKPSGMRPLGRTILEWTSKIIAVNWVDSAQDRNYWRALVNVALTCRFHKPWS